MPARRHYPEEVEALAARWRAREITNDRWTVIGKLTDVKKGTPGSESAPDMAQCGPLQCVMKPGVKKADDKYRAALEKIASDIGYDLGLSVPPVILWDRGEDTPADQERYVCLTAWAFEPVHTWEEAEAALGATEREKAAADICAIWPFETWIAAQDRGGKHVLVSLPATGEVPQTANIDYAFSMLHTWGNDRAHAAVSRPAWCANVPPDAEAIAQIVDKIEKFDETELQQIVNRIPEPFLPGDRKEIIMANLLNRKQKIRPVF